MIKVVAKNFVKKDKVEEVLELSKELVEETVKENGCISYEMYQDVKDNSILTMIETWENKDALSAHSKSEHFQRIISIMSTFMEKPAEMNMYNKILKNEIKNKHFMRGCVSIEYLEKYFTLFDESRISKKAREELISIFSENMSFVLNGYKKNGIEQWENFLDLIFTNNLDIKHMYEGWKFIEETKRYETRWAVCGKLKDGTVYTQNGKDIAELDEDGKIKYLENIPDNSGIFNSYK